MDAAPRLSVQGRTVRRAWSQRREAQDQRVTRAAFFWVLFLAEQKKCLAPELLSFKKSLFLEGAKYMILGKIEMYFFGDGI